MGRARRERRLIAAMDAELERDVELSTAFRELPARRRASRARDILLRPSGLWSAVATTIALLVLLALLCAVAAAYQRVWIVVLAMFLFPVALLPLSRVEQPLEARMRRKLPW